MNPVIFLVYFARTPLIAQHAIVAIIILSKTRAPPVLTIVNRARPLAVTLMDANQATLLLEIHVYLARLIAIIVQLTELALPMDVPLVTHTTRQPNYVMPVVITVMDVQSVGNAILHAIMGGLSFTMRLLNCAMLVPQTANRVCLQLFAIQLAVNMASLTTN